MSGDKRALLEQLRIDREQREPPSLAGGRRGWIWGAAAAAAVLAAAAGWFLLGSRTEVEAAVASAPSSAGGTSAILQATGYVTARRQATVSAQITGTLTQVLIEEGEKVAAGQVLARVEDSSQRAAVAQSHAQLEVAQALLRQYHAQLEQARRDLKRAQDLVGQHLVSQQALEGAQTQVDTLLAQVQSQDRAVELARAGLKGAQVQLGYTVIRAPFAGVITAKAAQPGEIVSPISAGGGFTRTGIGTVVDMDSLEIEVDVNEAYINRVRAGQPAEAVLDAYPDWKLPAHVIALIPTADRAKATVKVRVAIDVRDARILPDMGVRVSFLEEPAAAPAARPAGDSALVPATAVIERDGRSLVFLLQGDRVRARRVTAGESAGGMRSVGGLAPGERIVRSPPAALADGARVRVR